MAALGAGLFLLAWETRSRYLVCLLPLLLLVRPKALCLAGDCRRGIVLAAALVDIGVLLNVFLAVVAR